MCDCEFQHSPSIHVQSKFSCEMLDFWGWKSFGEGVSDHVIGGTEYKSDFAIINYPVDEIEMDVNMLCAYVVLEILGEHNGRLVV